MSLTLNQIVRRIETVVLAHKQVRTFKRGLNSDFDTDHTMKYPAVNLYDTGGTISAAQTSTFVNFQMHILDLVHVSQDTKTNEPDVLSDMFGVAQDLMAQLLNPVYNDWRISVDAQVQFIVESTGDMAAGVQLDFTVTIPFTQNACAVPSDLIPDIPDATPDDMKLVYDLKYVADGTEGTTLSIGEILGKRILLVTRENDPLHKVSNLPDPAEYTWNDVVIGLGVVVNPGERFLILYRTY